MPRWARPLRRTVETRGWCLSSVCATSTGMTKRLRPCSGSDIGIGFLPRGARGEEPAVCTVRLFSATIRSPQPACQQVVLRSKNFTLAQQRQQEFRCPGVEQHQFALSFEATAERVEYKGPEAELEVGPMNANHLADFHQCMALRGGCAVTNRHH